MTSVFIDTQCLIAANVRRDIKHVKAITLLNDYERANYALVTTDSIVIEFCNMLSRVSLRTRASRIVAQLRSNGNVEIVHVTRELLDRAQKLYDSRSDKEWGLTDCISFEVMRERKIKLALTADHHFAQAGFTALLA